MGCFVANGARCCRSNGIQALEIPVFSQSAAIFLSLQLLIFLKRQND